MGRFKIGVARDSDHDRRRDRRGQGEGVSGIDHGRHATKIVEAKSNGGFAGVVAASD